MKLPPDADKTSDAPTYRKSSTEKFLVRVIFDVFIAPVYAAIATGFVIGFDVLLLALGAALPHLLASYYFAELPDEGTRVQAAIAVAAVSAFLLACMLPTVGSWKLAIPVGLSVAIAGLIGLKVDASPSPVHFSLISGVGSAFGAILYWTLLENRQRSSIGTVLSKSYANISALNQIPKDDIDGDAAKKK